METSTGAFSPHVANPPSLLRGIELQRVLGVSDSTLRLWRRRGLPFIGGGHTRPRYQLEAVFAWLNQPNGRRTP